MALGRWSIAILSSLTLAGCSTSGAIERMAGEDGKREAFALADMLCSGDPSALKPRFDARLWEESKAELEKVTPYCPNGSGKKRLTGYFWESRADADGAISQKKYVVVTESPGKWTTNTFILESRSKGPERIVTWTINAAPTKPADLEMIDAFDARVPMFRAIGIAALLLTVSLIGGLVWYFRRQHKKQKGGEGR